MAFQRSVFEWSTGEGDYYDPVFGVIAVVAQMFLRDETGVVCVFAFVNLEDRSIWLVKKDELPELAQQHANGKYHFFMKLDPSSTPRRDGKRVHAWEFTGLLLENRVHEVG